MQFTAFASFPAESWRVRPRPGSTAWDRASLSHGRPQLGPAPARCVIDAALGVEPRSSDYRVHAGHRVMLAPVVNVAVVSTSVALEVKIGTA